MRSRSSITIAGSRESTGYRPAERAEARVNNLSPALCAGSKRDANVMAARRPSQDDRAEASSSWVRVGFIRGARLQRGETLSRRCLRRFRQRHVRCGEDNA